MFFMVGMVVVIVVIIGTGSGVGTTLVEGESAGQILSLTKFLAENARGGDQNEETKLKRSYQLL